MLRHVGIAVLFMTFAAVAAADVSPDRPTTFVSVRALTPFSFDVEDGHYETRNVPVDCGTNAIWLKAHFTRLGKPTTKWVPAISLSVESVSTLGGIQIEPEDFKAPLQVIVQTFDLKSNTQIQSVVLYNSFGLDTFVPVLVSWSPEGLVTFNVGGETRSINLKGPVLQTSVSGSTAAGKFDTLELGRISGTDTTASCSKSDTQHR